MIKHGKYMENINISGGTSPNAGGSSPIGDTSGWKIDRKTNFFGGKVTHLRITSENENYKFLLKESLNLFEKALESLPYSKHKCQTLTLKEEGKPEKTYYAKTLKDLDIHELENFLKPQEDEVIVKPSVPEESEASSSTSEKIVEPHTKQSLTTERTSNLAKGLYLSSHRSPKEIPPSRKDAANLDRERNILLSSHRQRQKETAPSQQDTASTVQRESSLVTEREDEKTTAQKPQADQYAAQRSSLFVKQTEKFKEFCEEKIATDLQNRSHHTYDTGKHSLTLFKKEEVTEGEEPYEVFLRMEELGKGAFKTANKAYDIFQKEHVAILTSTMPAGGFIQHNAEQEVKNFNLFKGSEYIVQLKKVSWVKEGDELQQTLQQTMVMELCNLGDLWYWISDQKTDSGETRSLTFSQKVQVAHDITCGINEIHDQGCVHGDLKPENIYLKNDPNQPELISAKVGDLGIMHQVEKQVVEGTATFMAPRHLEQYITAGLDDLDFLPEDEPQLMTNKTQEQKFADETFELGLVHFRSFFPDEFESLPWLADIDQLTVDLEYLNTTLSEEVDAIYNLDTGVMSAEEFEEIKDEIFTEYNQRKESMLENIDTIQLDIQEFVLKNLAELEKIPPPIEYTPEEIEVRKTIFKMLNLQDQIPLHQANEFFTELVNGS